MIVYPLTDAWQNFLNDVKCCAGPRGGGGGGYWVFFWWVSATRDSKLAPRSKKNCPKIDTPFYKIILELIPCSRNGPILQTLLKKVGKLNRIFKSNMFLNNFKWLLTKLELRVRNIIPHSRKCLCNGYPIVNQELQNHDPVGRHIPVQVMYGSTPPHTPTPGCRYQKLCSATLMFENILNIFRKDHSVLWTCALADLICTSSICCNVLPTGNTNFCLAVLV